MPLDGAWDIEAVDHLVDLSLNDYADDNAGSSIVTADYDGDGVDDLLVGAPNVNGIEEASDYTGAVYVILGPIDGDREVADVDATILGPEGLGGFGTIVATGDTDWDGATDLLVANTRDQEGSTKGGTTWLLASTSAGTIDVEEVASATFLASEEDMALGDDVDLGDVDGDGRDDVVLGAPYSGDDYQGEVFVWWGPSSGDHVTDTADVAVGCGSAGFAIGSITSTAHLDDDEAADLVISAPFADPEGDQSGAAYLFLGTSLN